MMRKRFIVGVLVLSMLLMGTGYAYWTDKLDIRTTASTGELKVKFMDLSLYGQYANPDNEGGWSIIHGIDKGATPGYTGDYYFKGAGRSGATYNKIASDGTLEAYDKYVSGYTTTTFDALLENNVEQLGSEKYGPGSYPASTNLADTISITLDKVYPGYAQVFQADIANMGTLTAKLSGIVAKTEGTINDDTLNMLGVALHIKREYCSTETGQQQGHVNVFKSLAEGTTITDKDFFRLGNVDFIRLSALPKLYTATDAIENEFLYVDPDDNRMDVYFSLAMDPDAEGKYTTGKVVGDRTVSDNADADTQLKSAYVTVEFLWDQFNVDYDTNKAWNNILSTK
ncbi:signal peptide protein [Lachnospiraceae bacterium MD1]|uniref:Signal peptide protein n=1 Tax=Variimorphobacter saccharofermentans TaxID=2755051 RepID=A0A839JXR9_9FIRM|nr:hypothetical protein [Variimorphobacter saccharofermentans]MBB2182463.1 signal peptide protein [Variimorphobacter saccharofermentans]